MSEGTSQTKSTRDLLAEFTQMFASMNQDFYDLKDRFVDLSGDGRDHAKPGMKEKTSKPKGDEYIVALGTNTDVPKYLRFKGRVRNRLMTKAQLEAFIREIMILRFSDKDEESPVLFQEFMFQELQKRFGIQSMIAEWGYSMHDALRRYAHDPDSDLFSKILEGEIGEEVYFEQMKSIERLRKSLCKLDMENNGGKVTGILNKSEIRSLVRKQYPMKTEDEFSAIFKALDNENPSGSVEYERLFTESREGDQTSFIEEIRSQNIRERQAYVKEIEDCVRDLSIDGIISFASARQAICNSDPKKPKSEVTEYLLRGFKLPDVPVDPTAWMIRTDDFLKNIRFCVLKRHSKREFGPKRKRLASIQRGYSSESSASLILSPTKLDSRAALLEEAEPNEV
eukprot:TRINITY_DN1811_c0_g1_i3.p1 TRINITY_DN1811_c0_g1~~TRINITY_DN1811_c0_g1_i3.p1  ORF type:complete len:396 (-),score=89.85 TRINITY_DN1811_c0_g1_i3:186-1373(-)